MSLPYELKSIPGYRARAGGPQIGQYIGALPTPPHPTRHLAHHLAPRH